MNAPDPSEHIVLLPGEQKVVYQQDTALSDAGTFVILKEDHTLGNPLRCQLLRDERVVFAGYRLPHPLVNVMNLKIRSRPESDPQTLLITAIDQLSTEVTSIKEQFQKQIAQAQSQHRAQHEM